VLSVLRVLATRDHLHLTADGRHRPFVFFAPVASIYPFYEPQPDWQERAAKNPLDPIPAPLQRHDWFAHEYPIISGIQAYGPNRWSGEDIVRFADELDKAASDPRLAVPADAALAARLLRRVAHLTAGVEFPGL
jgi:hypothetical protein